MRSLSAILLACLCGCGDDSPSGSGGDGSSSTGAPSNELELIGEWVDDAGVMHRIDASTWFQAHDPDALTYFIDHFDNDANYLVARLANDDTWSRFDWTFVQDVPWFCESARGLASAQAAEATAAADASAPATGGCMGGPWTALAPQ
ncbi:MAG: hypothetical protein K1X88_35570 [Nannocystaceae bacterium]|nr:hypothetical protein [Nannocystaceae bacterium]